MVRSLLSLCLLLLYGQLMAQGVGINNPTPHASALLDLTSTDKGLLVPRMTTAQRDGIPLPATSLLVYNTTNARFEFFNGSAWVPLVVSGGTLDQAYDFGGAGAGRTITADAGAVRVDGTDGLQVTGTLNSGANLDLAGSGVRMFFYPRKAAFRAGNVFGTQWDDANIGVRSVAFGSATASGQNSFASGGSSATGLDATALGNSATASGTYSISMGYMSNASSIWSTAIGYIVSASGAESTSIGSYSTASGYRSVALGCEATASGSNAKSFSHVGSAFSYGETALGIGPTNYTPSTNGATEFRVANATDRLLVVGNAIDANNNNSIDAAERSNAFLILKNGNTAIGNITPTTRLDVDGQVRIRGGNPAAGRVLRSDATGLATWVDPTTTASGTLDQAYDFGGAGAGRTITADAGAVTIAGTDGLVSTGSLGNGDVAPSGAGVRMVWNPRKAAFRAGSVDGTQWDDAQIGDHSSAWGRHGLASGEFSTAWGFRTQSTNQYSTAWGILTESTGQQSTAWGRQSRASGTSATAWGSSLAVGFLSTSWGNGNAFAPYSSAWGNGSRARSFGETALGIGPTDYTPSTNGVGQFRPANATDRLLVVGNAIDANNNDVVDDTERSNAFLILKNGNTAIGNIDPTTRLDVDGQVRIRGGNPAAGRVLMGDATGLATWVDPSTTASGTLDQAYDFGGPGAGRTITADAGAVQIGGTDGFISTGTLNTGAIGPNGDGVKMFWNPRKAAFRAGTQSFSTSWDDVNVGNESVAFGRNTVASGQWTAAWGLGSRATAVYATAFGNGNLASGAQGTAFGVLTTASGGTSTAWGGQTVASGNLSTAWGQGNTAPSFGETVLGIGATAYTPSLNGATQWRAANATDRLLVVGNAIDANNNNVLDPAEQSNAFLILKNGNTAIGNIDPTTRLDVDGQVRIRGGNPAAGRVLMGDATGLATWVDPTTITANAWGLNGNSGSTPATNFIGTTDAQSLRFRTNNAWAGQLPTATNGLLSLGVLAGQNSTGTGNAIFGNNAGQQLSSGSSNTFIGTQAGSATTTGVANVHVGFRAGASSTSGDNNVFVGTFAGSANTGSNNTYVGLNAGVVNSSGSQNAFLGTASGFNNSTGGFNTFVGVLAGTDNSTGSQNTFVGWDAGGGATLGSALSALGYNTTITGNLTNATAIGANARVTTSNSMVLGSINGENGATASTNVGIGTSAPARRLHVATGTSGATPNNNAAVVVEGGAAAYQHYLVPSTAESGLLFGTDAASIRSGIIFNNTLVPDGLQFRTGGNTNRMSITDAGLVGIGTTAPTTRLQVNGAVAVTPPAVVTANAQPFVYDAGDRSYIRMSSNLTPVNRIVALEDGLSTGQMLVVECAATGTNGIRFQDTGNMNVAGTRDLLAEDTITFIWNGTKWLEISYANN